MASDLRPRYSHITAKRPGRVRMLVIPIVIVAVGALFYVIGANLFDSIGSIM